jgi:hypothetical protein
VRPDTAFVEACMWKRLVGVVSFKMILASTQIICNIVCASARSNLEGITL